MLPGLDGIPGARGCTPQSCGFRDHAAELAAFGARVAGPRDLGVTDNDLQELPMQSFKKTVELAQSTASSIPIHF